MAVYLKNASDSVVYTFPPHDAITGRVTCLDEEGQLRVDTSDRLFCPGATIIGDLNPAPKTIILKGVVIATTTTALIDELKAIRYQTEVASRSERRLYLSQYPNEYYKIGAMSNPKIKYHGGLSAEVEIEILLADPLRYARELDKGSDVEGSCTLNASTAYTIAYPAACYPAAPVTTIVCTTGRLSSCIIRNTSDVHSDGTDKQPIIFGYELQAAEEWRIDHELGTVEALNGRFPAGGVDMIKWMTGGEFYRLMPGTNTLRYKLTVPAAYVGSTVVTISHSWRPRWL